MKVKIAYAHTVHWEEEYNTLQDAIEDIQTKIDHLPKGDKLEGNLISLEESNVVQTEAVGE